ARRAPLRVTRIRPASSVPVLGRNSPWIFVSPHSVLGSRMKLCRLRWRLAFLAITPGRRSHGSQTGAIDTDAGHVILPRIFMRNSRPLSIHSANAIAEMQLINFFDEGSHVAM